ncbi:hypothetical protein B9G55_04990 [Saccharibacillus sp. O16]|nr:hypothetical protein B9G55_04990 [Saccharibacillus sp. O16]
MMIRSYEKTDEPSWLRCRVLSLLNTAYYDDVRQIKDTYKSASIELVAAEGEEIIGLIDLELDTHAGEVCSNPQFRGAMIRNLAVHPDHQRKGIGQLLLLEALERSRAAGTQYLEAWTRDDQWVRDWYDKMGFRPTESCFEVYIESEEDLKAVIECKVPHLRPKSMFAHYDGSDKAFVFSKFSRAHEVIRYDLEL